MILIERINIYTKLFKVFGGIALEMLNMFFELTVLAYLYFFFLAQTFFSCFEFI